MRTGTLFCTTGPKRLKRTFGPALNRQTTWLQMVGKTQREKVGLSVKKNLAAVNKATRCGRVMGQGKTEQVQDDIRNAYQDAVDDQKDAEEARLAYWRGMTDGHVTDGRVSRPGIKQIEGFNNMSEASKKEFWYEIVEDISTKMDRDWLPRWQGHKGYQTTSYRESMLDKAVSEGRAIVPAGKPGYVPPVQRYQQSARNGVAAPRVPTREPINWTCGECNNNNSVAFNPWKCGACPARRPAANDLAEPLLVNAVAAAAEAGESINQQTLGQDAGVTEHGYDFAVTNIDGQKALYERLREYMGEQRQRQA